MYLLDTDLVSELIKPRPKKSVIDWVENCDEESLFLSVITVGELQKGVSKLPDSRRKRTLQSWLERDIRQRFEKRILDITPEVIIAWGKLQAETELNGQKLPVTDSLIAATAQIHNMTVVTRNVSDMERCGVEVLNPWDI